MTNALYSIALSMVTPVSSWLTADIDEILSFGDKMYLDVTAKLGISTYLHAEELPENISVRSSLYTVIQSVIFGELIFNDSSEQPASCILGTIQSALSDQYCGCIIILSVYAFSLIRSDNRYYSFDPHSRDNNGMVNANGRAVVMDLGDDCQDVADFIIKLAKSLGLHMHQQCRYEVIPIQLISKSLSDNATEAANSSLTISGRLMADIEPPSPTLRFSSKVGPQSPQSSSDTVTLLPALEVFPSTSDNNPTLSSDVPHFLSPFSSSHTEVSFSPLSLSSVEASYK